VHPDVTALLAVQSDDVVIHGLEARLAELAPRIEALAAEREQAVIAVKQARASVESEERRQREVQSRVAQHRQLHERNQSQLNSITSQREATAAMAQLEQAKRMIDEDDRELGAIAQRLAELRHAAAEREAQAKEIERVQEEARDSMSEDSKDIQTRLDSAKADRAAKASHVPRTLLGRYERIRSRSRIHAVYPLRGQSCSNCDTTIPLQRRSAMMGSGATDICEGCGVMLYAGE
jgi:predicted  nucleic acid-binding Zn-ribbon protein